MTSENLHVISQILLSLTKMSKKSIKDTSKNLCACKQMFKILNSTVKNSKTHCIIQYIIFEKNRR